MDSTRRQILRAASAAMLLSSLRATLAVSAEPMQRAPAMFIGHGSPMNAISDNAFTRSWVAEGRRLERPRAILSVSAHWLSRGATYVTENRRPRTLYDMRGFPDALYEVDYAPPGAPGIAGSIAALNTARPTVPTDQWGLDHGTWSVLVHLMPEADIPVLQLSIDVGLSLEEHLALGTVLRSLRDDGVLILGSGNIVHNLRLRRPGAEPFDWALEFDQTVARHIDNRDFARALELGAMGDMARLAHPSLDHYLPLIYAMGAIDEGDDVRWFSEGFDKATLGMRSFIAAPREA